MVESQPKNLEQLLELLIRAGQSSSGATVSVRELLDATGRRSFGALLLVPGLLVASPLSGIPGMATTAAIIVMLIAGQLLIGRERFWLPAWMLRQEFDQAKVKKALRFLQRPARLIDKLLRERFLVLTRGPAVYLIGAICMLLAIAMPPLELIPFASSTVGTVLASFGLALVARDGLLVSLGLALCVGGAVLAGVRVL